MILLRCLCSKKLVRSTYVSACASCAIITGLIRFLSSSSPQNDNEAWAVGGGGSLWYSTDGGETFKFSSGATNIGANLYDVKFFGGDKGFAIGSDGVLLK